MNDATAVISTPGGVSAPQRNGAKLWSSMVVHYGGNMSEPALALGDGQAIELGAQRAYNRSMSSKDERLHLRVEPEQKALLEAASRASGDTVSAFVLHVATEAAVDILADRRVFVPDEPAWQVFDQALSRPAKEVPGLRELLSAPTVLDDDGTAPEQIEPESTQPGQ